MNKFMSFLASVALAFATGIPAEVETTSVSCPWYVFEPVSIQAGPTSTAYTATTTTSVSSVDCHGCATVIPAPSRILPFTNVVGPDGVGHDANGDFLIKYETTITAAEPKPTLGYACLPSIKKA